MLGATALVETGVWPSRAGATGAILPSKVEEASPKRQAASAKKDLTGAATVV